MKLPSVNALKDVQKELAIRKLSRFAQLIWPVLEPGTPLVWGWYLDAICDHLEAVTNGHIQNLIISMPPRHGKSTLVSVIWPAWEWITKPYIRYLTASYSKELAIRDAVRTRRVLQSEQYQQLIKGADGKPLFELTGDQNLKSRYENTQTGWRICTSVDSGATGEGGNRVMVDDAHNMREIHSDPKRQAAIDWWAQVMGSRRNDAKNDARIVVGQRGHEDDLTGNLLRLDIYDHLCLSAMYESDHPHKSKTFLNYKDPRTKDGELLCAERFGQAEVEEAQKDMGKLGFIAQYQQRPAPAEGGIFKKSQFQRYVALPRFDRIVSSWDLSLKGEEKTKNSEIRAVLNPSFVVGQLWGFTGPNAYLIEEVRGQWGLTLSMERIIQMKKRWPAMDTIYIEDKANGTPAIQMLRNEIPGIIPVEPKVSKTQRAMAIQPFVESGNVHIPSDKFALWVDDWLYEVCSFPFGRKNDRVDAMTQALQLYFIDGYLASRKILENMTTW